MKHYAMIAFSLFFTVVGLCSYVSYLEGNAADRQVLVILQHAQVLRHECRSVDQTHGRLGVTISDVVVLRHVLQPRQPQVRGGLVALRNPEQGILSQRCSFSEILFIRFLI